MSLNFLSMLKTGIVGTLGTLVISSMIEEKMTNYDKYIYPPIDTVSIIMPSFNEEAHIEQAVSSIRNQSIIQEYPQYFEFILVDSQSQDKTVELAEPYVDKIISVPIRGKLTARNIATDYAKGNIIVSTDSDCYYPYNWLNTLLKPFSETKYYPIVGVSGSTFDSGIKYVPSWLHSIGYVFDRTILHPKQMPGRNSAYYKHMFYLSGRFDDINTNQFDIDSMLTEEEKGLGNRLSKYGKLVFKANASCIHLGGERISCRFGLESQNKCNRYGIGTDRF